MDPTNNPTPTTPGPEPTAGPAPDPNAGMPSGAAPADSAPVGPTPAGPADAPSPVESGAPATAPNPPVGVPANPVTNMPTVNPVIAPGGAQGAGPVNPVVRPSGIGVTDPIMVPEKPQAPDPVEEELKAPMKAAGPVPGSIGSAVSGPSDSIPDANPAPADNPFAGGGVKQTPSVSFNDPASQADANAANPADLTAQAAADKKKPNKTTLIALIAVAAVIVVVLIVFLIMQVTSGGGGNSNSGNANSNNTSSNTPITPIEDDDNDDNTTGKDDTDTTDNTDKTASTVPAITCAASFTDDEGNTNTQLVSVMIEDNKLTEISGTVEVIDANGNNIGSSTQVMSIDKVLASAGSNDSEFVSNDGTLNVTVDKLSTELENALNQSTNELNSYTCTVTE